MTVEDDRPGIGARVVNYIKAGQAFGEIALLTALFPQLRAERPDVPRGQRSAGSV